MLKDWFLNDLTLIDEGPWLFNSFQSEIKIANKTFTIKETKREEGKEKKHQLNVFFSSKTSLILQKNEEIIFPLKRKNFIYLSMKNVRHVKIKRNKTFFYIKIPKSRLENSSIVEWDLGREWYFPWLTTHEDAIWIYPLLGLKSPRSLDRSFEIEFILEDYPFIELFNPLTFFSMKLIHLEKRKFEIKFDYLDFDIVFWYLNAVLEEDWGREDLEKKNAKSNFEFNLNGKMIFDSPKDFANTLRNFDNFIEMIKILDEKDNSIKFSNYDGVYTFDLRLDSKSAVH
jgi:hypothetical protein